MRLIFGNIMSKKMENHAVMASYIQYKRNVYKIPDADMEKYSNSMKGVQNPANDDEQFVGEFVLGSTLLSAARWNDNTDTLPL